MNAAKTGPGMDMSGFCAWPGLEDSHIYCKRKDCACPCHEQKEKN